MTDEEYMSVALGLAREAAERDEVPVGAIIVQDGEIIARASNSREADRRATAHAEVVAIESACARLGGWRLPRCTMYVTLEPCLMCAGALVNARIDRVVFGAYDPKAGAFGSKIHASELALNHTVLAEGGCMESECKEILSSYFKGKRKKFLRIYQVGSKID